MCEKLVSMGVTLNTIYDKTECATRETWSEPRRSTVLGHLEHCKEIMTWMGTVRPQSLFELCALAVRKSIGVNLGPKVARLNITQFCQDAILLRYLWPFVYKTEQYKTCDISNWSPSGSFSTPEHSHDFEFSDGSESNEED